MRYIVDANILLRTNIPADPQYPVIVHALRTLIQQGHEVCIVPQSLYELWAVATRPAANRGGFGWTPQDTEREIVRLEATFTLLPDRSPALFFEWRRLVNQYSVSGINAHDARLVAAMVTHSVTYLLTFNTTDFQRYTEIIPVLPQNV